MLKGSPSPLSPSLALCTEQFKAPIVPLCEASVIVSLFGGSAEAEA